MARIVIIGAGLGGLPAAYELRHRLPSEHRVTLISNHPKFTFIPSLPWVGLGLRSLDRIQLELAQIVPQHGIELILDTVTRIEPESRRIQFQNHSLHYDYVVIATGPELALDELPGLGPEAGYTQSICNPHHALLACEAWEHFLKNPGPIVVGAAPGASCFGPAYEFALLAHHRLRQLGWRKHSPITLVTSEPYVGHLGIGEIADSRWLIRAMLADRHIDVLDNVAISHIEPNRLYLADGRHLPFKYAMILPAFRGPQFLRETPGLTDSQGFVRVLPTYRHPEFDSIYSVGVVTQLKSLEATPIPIGVPKVGQMTEAMVMAVAHNIALDLGILSGPPIQPTLQAICFADFGDTGALFLADPLLPDVAGKRRQAFIKKGAWVTWAKTAFEHYFISKMRLGWPMPWFEQLGLQALGLPLVEPIRPISDVMQAEG